MDKNKLNNEHTPSFGGYAISIVFVILLFCIGIILQLIFGSFNFYYLSNPYNWIIGAIIIVFITILSFFRKNKFVEWLGGIPLSVSTIGLLLILTIFMGLIPQMVRVDENIRLDNWGKAGFGDISDYFFTKFGFKQMTTAWPFVLLYGLNLIVLGLATAKRLHNFKWRSYAFYLNHFGLWLMLFAAGIGAGDIKKFVMYVQKGETEWRVYNNKGEPLDLDIAITLHNFIMEEYNPKLAIINKYNGDVIPYGRPEYYQINEKRNSIQIEEWTLVVDKYLHEAIRQNDSLYIQTPMPGSMPAADISVTNNITGQTVSGWVTCGSFDQNIKPLELDSLYAVVMTKPEPKRFASDITVYTRDSKDGHRKTIEVNHPLQVGDWTIYQYDYDQNLGKASMVSGFELVYDPWIYIVYVGCGLLALGSVCMLWVGNRKRKDNEK